jgi:hypothetical protein
LNQTHTKSIGFDDFLAINMPSREMLLDPILPERSLAMLYAPRGVGKTLLSLSIGLAVASGASLLRWHAPMSMEKCRSSHYRNGFERFRLMKRVSDGSIATYVRGS